MKPEQTPGDQRLKPEEPSGYEPPLVEDIPADDGPAVAAAGVVKSPPSDDAKGAEWRPAG
jgi:hypothetical protein